MPLVVEGSVDGVRLHETGVQMGLLQHLLHETTPNSIGAICSYLHYLSQRDPEVLRRCMNEKVIREGFAGISLLEMLNRVCR